MLTAHISCLFVSAQLCSISTVPICFCATLETEAYKYKIFRSVTHLCVRLLGTSTYRSHVWPLITSLI